MSPPFQSESLYRKLSLGLLLVCLFLGFATIQDYGMGWDEVTRWKSGDAKVEYYSKLLSSEHPLDVVKAVPNDRYPGFFDMSLSLWHRATGWDRFLLGHWQAFLFGLAGLTGLWRIGCIFGGARLGFWSVLIYALNPVFYGHWFQNPKDIPFAAMYTLGLWALIECFSRYPMLRIRWIVGAALLCGLCMATRIAGVVLLAYCAAAVLIISMIYVWERRASVAPDAAATSLWRWWLILPAVALGAYVTLLPWWPAAHKDLLSVPGSTLQELHISASDIPLLFRGQISAAADAPHYYSLWMFAIKATELLLLGLVLALPMAWMWLRSAWPEDIKAKIRLAPAVALLGLGGIFPLLYLTTTAPALHNGVRHFLFSFPALSVCSAWAYLEINQWLAAHRPSLQAVAKFALAVLVALPVFHLVKLHPYQYTYFNSLAGGPSGAYGYYEGEYWFTSSKHALEQLHSYLEANPAAIPGGGKPRIFILGPWQVAEPFLPDGWVLSSNRAEADFLILNTQMMVHRLFDGEEIFRIERMGVPICIVLSKRRI